MTKAITLPTIPSLTMKSLPWKKSTTSNDDQNIITKQGYVLEIAIGVLADVITK
jgi:hypothetical protein